VLYLGRHGSTVLNPGDPEDPRDYHRGWAEEVISELGTISANEMGLWFKDQPLDYIVSSPLQRARQTANIISEITKVPVLKLDPRLMTWNLGVFSGNLATPQTHALLDIYQYELPEAKVPFGESYHTFVRRWAGGISFWLEKSKEHDILLLTHHRPILAIPLVLWGEKAKKEGPPGPGGVVVLEKKELKVVFESPSEEKALHGNSGK